MSPDRADAQEVPSVAPGASPAPPPSAATDKAPAAPAAVAPEPSRQVDQVLTLQPGASCLERGRLIERIARWRERATLDLPLEVHVRGDAQAPTRVFFSVTREGTPPTERMLDNAPSDCDQLHSAVALSIALAIDAILSGNRSPAPPLPAAQPSEPEAAKPRRQQGMGPYIELGLLGGASVGVVTNTALAGLPRLQVAPLPWLSLALAGIATRAVRTTFADVQGHFSTTLLAGGVDACVGGETAERLSFFMCGGARVGGFTTGAEGYSTDYVRTRVWWALAASGQARAWIVPSVAIGLSLEALFALAERRLALQSETPGVPDIQRPMPRVGLSIAVGPVFRFY